MSWERQPRMEAPKVLEFLRQHASVQKYIEQYATNYGDKVELACQVVMSADMYSYRYTIGYRSMERPDSKKGQDIWASLITFSITPYPACCGLTLFHSFSYFLPYGVQGDEVLLAELKQYVFTCINENMGGNKHLEAIMISSEHNNQRVTSNTKEAPSDTFEGPVSYPLFLEMFQSTAKRVDIDKGFWNTNSGNLMHRVDVYY